MCPPGTTVCEINANLEYREQSKRRWNDAIENAARENRDIEEQEVRLVCKMGETLIVELSGITIRDKFLATFVDQTDRVKAEEIHERTQAIQ